MPGSSRTPKFQRPEIHVFKSLLEILSGFVSTQQTQEEEIKENHQTGRKLVKVKSPLSNYHCMIKKKHTISGNVPLAEQDAF